MKETRLLLSFLITTSTLTFLSSCSDDKEVKETYNLEEKDDAFGKANDVFTAEEWYPGGELGTTTKRSYSAPAPHQHLPLTSWPTVRNVLSMERISSNISTP